MTATANPIHLMHIMNVHSIQTSHWQAATEEQLMILCNQNRTLPSISPSTFSFHNYIQLQKQMGKVSEYKTFNGQIGKGRGISAPSPHSYTSTAWESLW